MSLHFFLVVDTLAGKLVFRPKTVIDFGTQPIAEDLFALLSSLASLRFSDLCFASFVVAVEMVEGPPELLSLIMR